MIAAILLLSLLSGMQAEETSCIDKVKDMVTGENMAGGWSKSNVTADLTGVLDTALASADGDKVMAVKDGAAARITQVYSQVVSGMNYCIEFEGNEATDDAPADCAGNTEHDFCTNTQKCSAEIYHQSWTKTTELKNIKCQDNEGSTGQASKCPVGQQYVMLFAGLLVLQYWI